MIAFNFFSGFCADELKIKEKKICHTTQSNRKFGWFLGRFLKISDNSRPKGLVELKKSCIYKTNLEI